MGKKASIFKEFKSIRRINTAVAVALLWVVIGPALGSLGIISYLANQGANLAFPNFLNIILVSGYILTGTLAMGLALLPTTLFAAVSGYLFGWQVFPALVLAYLLASVLGYAWGSKLGVGSKDLILERYPKARKVFVEKQGSMGSLIFFVRISPVIPFALSNLLFAMVQTGYRRLIIFGTLGMLPRTILAFTSGTFASGIMAAIRQEGVGGKGWIFVGLLVVSVLGIVWVFKGKSKS